MRRTKAKAIFFDLGETLVTQNIEDNMVTKRALDEVARILPRPRPKLDLFDIYQQGYIFNHAIRSKHHVEIPVQVWMRQLLMRALGREPPTRLIDQAIRIIVTGRAGNARAFEDAEPALARLTEKKSNIGVISNVSSHEVAVRILKNVRLYKYFRQIVTSAQTGIRKPDPGIFQFALQRFGIRPSQGVHVGDSEHHDVQGANAVGMTAVLVSRQNKREPTIADFRFTSLAEASDLLVSL